jgi:hypothetical protein
MLLLNLFESIQKKQITEMRDRYGEMSVGDRYHYWYEEEIEPEENVKKWHYIEDKETGKIYEPDWSPYSTMQPTDVAEYMRLTNELGGEPTREEAGTIGPLDNVDLKKIAISRRSSMRETAHLDEVEFQGDKKFPDTAQGAKAALAMMTDMVSKELDQFLFFPDPSVDGVWGADNPNGTRIIIYLAGYKTPFGKSRKHNDFEEGEWIDTVRDNERYKEQLIRKIKEKAVSNNSDDTVNEAAHEYDRELLNAFLKEIITDEFGGKAWANGGSYNYLIDVTKPNVIFASDTPGDPRMSDGIRVSDWASGLKEYMDGGYYRELATTLPDYWAEAGILLPVRSIRNQGVPEGRGDSVIKLGDQVVVNTPDDWDWHNCTGKVIQVMDDNYVVKLDDGQTLSVLKHELKKQGVAEGWVKTSPPSLGRIRTNRARRRVKTPEGKGVIVREYKRPPFSQLRPLFHTILVKLDSGEEKEFPANVCKLIKDKQGVAEDWQKVNRKDKTSGMSKKAVKAYRRENPGSKLQTAVTTKPSKLKKGSKSAKRRKSFCARMKGMKKSRTGAKTKRNPNSNINKALRRWNCESVDLEKQSSTRSSLIRALNAGTELLNAMKAQDVERVKFILQHEAELPAELRSKAYKFLGQDTKNLNENLRKWFKEKWVRFGPDGKIRGDCARGDDSEGKPKCLPQSKAQSLGKKGRASAASRKRREDPNPERRGKAINVNTKKKSNEGVVESSDISGLMTAAKMVKDYIVTAEVDGVTKKFRIRGMTGPNAAKERFLKHYNQAKVLNVEEEVKLDEACWKGYHKEGNKKMFGKIYPNCVKNTNEEQELEEKWSQKYKDSINCSNPKGFSQKAHCAGKKKNEDIQEEKCPYCGGPMFSEMIMNEKKDACYYKVKSRYKVWPSAYASGALVRCRKKGAKNWGSKS